MKIKFVDLNHNLVEKVREIGIEAICADYFLEICRTERPVMMTASNPMWSFGGGIDALFKKNYPNLVGYKQVVGGGNERIGNICFVVSVDKSLRATKELIKEALKFGIANTSETETLVVSGIGTQIGGLSEEEFVEVLKDLVNLVK